MTSKEVAFDPELRTRSVDVLDPARACALLTALGSEIDIRAGAALPSFFHHLYFWQVEPPQALGRDGHPKVGGVIPDMGLPRRMWAGGRLQFHRPLVAGIEAEKVTRCVAANRKQGRSGSLGFVTLCHEIWQDGRLCLTEWQDLVYREEVDPDARRPTPPIARQDEDHSERVTFNPTLLFRYSALTFNGHRIHYDLPYARQVEGYAGLVVHGPLLAQLLMLQAVGRQRPLASFAFRATAPLMDFEPAELCQKEGEFWVRGPDGRQCMVAEAVFD